MGRLSPHLPPEVALTREEIQLIDVLYYTSTTSGNITTKPLSYYLNKIAILGGYMNRTSDPPPGNIIMWRGLSRLTGMKLGLRIGLRMTCG